MDLGTKVFGFSAADDAGAASNELLPRRDARRP